MQKIWIEGSIWHKCFNALLTCTWNKENILHFVSRICSLLLTIVYLDQTQNGSNHVRRKKWQCVWILKVSWVAAYYPSEGAGGWNYFKNNKWNGYSWQSVLSSGNDILAVARTDTLDTSFSQGTNFNMGPIFFDIMKHLLDLTSSNIQLIAPT